MCAILDLKGFSMRFKAIFIAGFCGLFFTINAQSHHGFTQYFDPASQVRIDGTVHAISIRNPHSHLEITVAGADGSEEIWDCETQAKSLLDRKGITESDFQIGDRIVVTGSQARREPTGCEIGSIYFANGDSITLRSTQGRARIAVNESQSEAPKKRDSIFGLWVRDSFSGVPVEPGFLDVINEAGRAVNERYNPYRDDPPLHCKPGTPVRAWAAPGNPTEIRRESDRILIRHEFMDTVRVVYLDQNTAPKDPAATEMGFSIGQFQGEELVVETSNFTDGVLLTHVGDSGVLHSDTLKLVERYRIDPDTGSLVFLWEATDPKYFTAPIKGGVSLSPTSLPVGLYNCEISDQVRDEK